MIDRDRICELRAEVGGDDLFEIVELFCEEVEETLERLAIQASPSILEDLHFLKGSANNIGMKEVGALCEMAEGQLRANPKEEPNLDEIAKSFKRGRQALLLELDR